ncbi:TPR domain-containing protein [Edwardsiella anguillarum]|uniref:TPR domain-containing protein n=1 Tax=Edwardsiella anguillarum TaxID=1821960 RepID=UPI0024B7D9E2|nr:heme lyase NrfEFG subunit NrfG [Edwardsiella anguillarum]WHP79656.1 heme lyase NrfEFG subunit NrfG [Edwardsiella anguillarum]WHQ17115.1 heme lyase NrfEFG subunit NrfG [Edwardsiella anguillarum]WHQ20651.1 heme lyase NrfEFG subunit NrfG [Edwardsiella anguillarum]WHQ24172.1 heme lyase NrfEFG subunit NrfG [Edwardsiella anguillarum]WHQ27742.1 heme lyase NrfEFG subunit NrfG [Edwardsiella anguillarum]
MSLWRALLPTLALSLALAGYGLSGRAALVLQAQRLRDDPQRLFTPQQQADRMLAQRWEAVRATPESGEAWAALGQHYLWLGQSRDALRAYDRAIALRADSAELWAARAAAGYYDAGQQMTPQVQEDISMALRLDPGEVSALMLLAADAFMLADYPRAIRLWQRLLDDGSARINRRQLIEAIATARMMQRQG